MLEKNILISGGEALLKIVDLNENELKYTTSTDFTCLNEINYAKFINEECILITDTKNPKDQGEIIINAAKTIQKWWRELLYKIFIILNVIKVQSKFRSFITRKKLSQNNNDSSDTSKMEKNIRH